MDSEKKNMALSRDGLKSAPMRRDNRLANRKPRTWIISLGDEKRSKNLFRISGGVPSRSLVPWFPPRVPAQIFVTLTAAGDDFALIHWPCEFGAGADVTRLIR
jgi:hypothetical protein